MRFYYSVRITIYGSKPENIKPSVSARRAISTAWLITQEGNNGHLSSLGHQQQLAT